MRVCLPLATSIGLFCLAANLAFFSPAKAEAAQDAAKSTKEAPAGEFSREALLKGARVPIRREYPLSKKVKPCDDFYKYTCENVISSFKLPADRSMHTFSLNDAAERLLQAKKTYLKVLAKSDAPSKRSTDLKNIYLACMDPDANKAQEKEFVAKEVAAIRGAKDAKDLFGLMSSRLDKPEFGFVGFETIPSQDTPDYDDVTIVSDLMSLPERSYYSDKAVVKDMQALMQAFFTTLGMSEPAKRAKAVLEVENAYAQVHPLPAEMRDRLASRNGIERSALDTNYTNLQLKGFLDKLPPRTQFRNLMPESLAFVNSAMTKIDLTTLQDLALYHSLSGIMDEAYPDFYKKGFEFRKKHLGGPEKRPDRDERCTRLVMHRFERELDAEVLPILFPDFPEKEFRQFVEKVRTSLIDGLKANSWLSPEGKVMAMKKMETARLMVVKPLNDDEWDFNPPGDYDPKKPLSNMKILDGNKIVKELKELAEARKRNRWLMGPLTVNAYYMPMDNTFVLPIGILQYPLYDPTLPESVNLGSIGSVIGHELGHGIDDKGAKYDEQGRFKNWMTDKDLAEFGARGDRFVEQFTKLGHNGKLTLGENIGDHVGLTTSYHAAFPEGATKANLAERQAFFVQYGRTWCQVIRPKLKDMILKTDPHALGPARVDQQVKNQPGFQEAFACKEKDPMFLDPKDRVRIW